MNDPMSIYDPEFVYIVTLKVLNEYKTLRFIDTTGNKASEYVKKPNFVSIFKQVKK